MPLLNTDNIKSNFLAITRLSSSEFDFQGIIDNARDYVEARIIFDSLTNDETSRCEYAACAHAVYEYTLQKLLTDRIVITQTGNAALSYRESSMLEAAKAFRSSVFNSVKDLIKDDSFVFSCMGG